ncbi:hypothetical protein MWR57_07290 [Desulfovibrionaceae bacterium CB1MN]|uniref:hypothetical protein n=1 Tax=Hydrosulfovibrio ferrireducens TaxID=2934181 RepID=UPI003ABB1A36
MVPRTAQETTRQAIVALLTEGPVSAKDISTAVHLPEKEVSSHLEHIRRSLHATGAVLAITPAECRACGFVFAKRDRMRRRRANARSAAARPLTIRFSAFGGGRSMSLIDTLRFQQ